MSYSSRDSDTANEWLRQANLALEYGESSQIESFKKALGITQQVNLPANYNLSPLFTAGWKSATANIVEWLRKQQTDNAEALADKIDMIFGVPE